TDAHATDRRRLHLVELLATLLLGLASATGRTTGSAERTLRAEATAATTTAATAATGRTTGSGRATDATTAGSASGTSPACCAGSARTRTGTGRAAEACGPLRRHHGR